MQTCILPREHWVYGEDCCLLTSPARSHPMSGCKLTQRRWRGHLHHAGARSSRLRGETRCTGNLYCNFRQEPFQLPDGECGSGPAAVGWRTGSGNSPGAGGPARSHACRPGSPPRSSGPLRSGPSFWDYSTQEGRRRTAGSKHKTISVTYTVITYISTGVDFMVWYWLMHLYHV
jgi:hypothetical protein